MEKMNWYKLLSKERFSISDAKDDIDGRTEFQRDIDRIVFSSAFRRLQNKTQVFPLPTNDFVRTRLTHSLEVAQVGRALGVLGGNIILKNEIELNGLPNREDVITYTEDDFGDIVVAACLAHDLGNPPFGHSGEKAIGHYFLGEGKKYIHELDQAMQNDFIHFEGNAAGLRILTDVDETKMEGGFRLSYATLGAFIKYPTNSLKLEQDKRLNELGVAVSNRKSLKKFNYFQSEKNTFKDICVNCGLIQISELESSSGETYVRHPLAFLMEAADTICYKLIDLEDGHKVGLIESSSVNSLLNSIIENNEGEINKRKLERINLIDGSALRVVPLIKRAIRVLVHECGKVFETNYEKIMGGTFDQEITDLIPSAGYLSEIENICRQKLYNQASILEVEMAGFEVMGGLLDFFLEAVFEENEKTKKAINLLPEQFLTYDEDGSDNQKKYNRIMNIVDYVSRMTDNYAMSIYKKVKGIESPSY